MKTIVGIFYIVIAFFGYLIFLILYFPNVLAVVFITIFEVVSSAITGSDIENAKNRINNAATLPALVLRNLCGIFMNIWKNNAYKAIPGSSVSWDILLRHIMFSISFYSIIFVAIYYLFTASNT